MKAYFDGDWKALWMPAPTGSGDWELFNLRSDPGELNDLGKEHPQKLAELVARWEEYRIANGVLDLSPNSGE